MTVPPLRRILLADDEPDIRAIVKIALETVGGYDVRVCATGEEAVREAVAYRPDLVLLDVMMPDMDGAAALEKIHADPLTSATPVVFLTARQQEAEIMRLRQAGAVWVLAKPFDPMELPGTVTEIWNRVHEL